MALSVKPTDLDAACSAYARATGDYPRREGIRVALHSYRQLTSMERTHVLVGLGMLRLQGCSNSAETIERLLGLDHE